MVNKHFCLPLALWTAMAAAGTLGTSAVPAANAENGEETRHVKLLKPAGGAAPALPEVPVSTRAEAPPAAAQRSTGTATAEARSILRRLEEAHKDLKTIQAEFEQAHYSELFPEEETKAKGTIYYQAPDRLRVEYHKTKQDNGQVTDPLTLLFVDNVFYQYNEVLNEVHSTFYKTGDMAREQLKTLMLGFGVSSEALLNSYDVELAPDEEKEKDGSMIGVTFKPLSAEVRKETQAITVWFEREKLWPLKARYLHASGEVTAITIKEMTKDSPIKAKVFSSDFKGWFGKKPKVIPHYSWKE